MSLLKGGQSEIRVCEKTARTPDSSRAAATRAGMTAANVQPVEDHGQ
jgi:hypothetical protein